MQGGAGLLFRRIAMQRLLANRWMLAGLLLVLLGWGPLLAIIALASLGLWPDPEPNPIGPGLLACLTFWPAILCLSIGAVRIFRDRLSSTASLQTDQ